MYGTVVRYGTILEVGRYLPTVPSTKGGYRTANIYGTVPNVFVC